MNNAILNTLSSCSFTPDFIWIVTLIYIVPVIYNLIRTILEINTYDKLSKNDLRDTFTFTFLPIINILFCFMSLKMFIKRDK